MASSNTEIWDKLCRVPKEHLKGFKRGGGFTGTAIKPMWSFHKMTEVFGPIGTAWTTSHPQFQIVPGDNKEVLVFCTVAVKVNGEWFHGVGGDKVVKYTPANQQYNRAERWENDDEAFKKAYTDAVTNALKLLGVGADVHMGLWDGNKYVDEKPEPKHQEPAAMGITPHPERSYASPDTAAINGTAGKSKNKDAKEAYYRLVRQMRDTNSIAGLKEWLKIHRDQIEALPEEWLAHFDDDYAKHKDNLSVTA